MLTLQPWTKRPTNLTPGRSTLVNGTQKPETGARSTLSSICKNRDPKLSYKFITVPCTTRVSCHIWVQNLTLPYGNYWASFKTFRLSLGVNHPWPKPETCEWDWALDIVS